LPAVELEVKKARSASLKQGLGMQKVWVLLIGLRLDWPSMLPIAPLTTAKN